MAYEDLGELERAFIAAVVKLRTALAKAETGSYFEFTAKATGRVQDGDVNVEFVLSKDGYSSVVKGDTVEAVTEEYLRRNGWQSAHNYLALPKSA